MSRIPAICFSIFLCIAGGYAQKSESSSWQQLVRTGKCQEARTFCEGLTTAGDIPKQAEGHKCLANVAFCGAKGVVRLERNDAGGGEMGTSYPDEVIDQALTHLNAALKLTPQDLSIHQGRLHVLEISFRYSDMTKALEESCKIYKGSDGLEAWLAYPMELYNGKYFRASVDLLNVLNKYYPDNHEVLGNLGALHTALKNDDQALRYLLRAVELAPNDPIDTWDLARLYDYTGKNELADQWYRKALNLETDPGRKRESSCAYGMFLEKKVKDRTRACELQKANCAEKDQTACSASQGNN